MEGMDEGDDQRDDGSEHGDDRSERDDDPDSYSVEDTTSGSEEKEGQDEEDDDAPPQGPFLGARQDRIALKYTLGQFLRDDLADSQDELVAAVRMQVHTLSVTGRRMRILLSCGLWLLLRPQEDQGVLLLTKKGRIINAGKSPAAMAGHAQDYLERILCVLLATALLLYILGRYTFGRVPPFFFILACILLLALLASYLYAQRPRNDCGSDFRQHFQVNDLCVATYARVDSWHYGFRRRRGHLRLCFGRYYPDGVTLSEGLPQGAPDGGGLAPLERLNPAGAGEKGQKAREEADHHKEAQRRHGKDDGIGAGTACLLATLGILGGLYEYMAIGRDTFEAQLMCLRKQPDCQWRLSNTAWEGKMREVVGTNPPWNYKRKNSNTGCDEQGHYCDNFYYPIEHCTPTFQTRVTEVRAPCEQLETILDALNATSVEDLVTGEKQLMYRVVKNISVYTLPQLTMPSGGYITLERSMTLESIEPTDVAEHAALLAKEPLPPLNRMMTDCQEIGLGALRFIFKAPADTKPLMEEDCSELQEACMAESFGPQTQGWWPLQRLLFPIFRLKRAVCSFHPVSMDVFGHGRSWHEARVPEAGLTCRGEPLKSLVGASKEACQEACKEQDNRRCSWMFHRDPLEGGNSSAPNCLLYESCNSQEPVEEDANFKDMDCGAKVQYLPGPAVEGRVEKQCEDEEDCQRICLEVAGRLCNAFSFEVRRGRGVCTLYGATAMGQKRKGTGTGFKLLPVNRDGRIGEEGAPGSCFERLPPLPSNLERTGTRGVLMKYTDKLACNGCILYSISQYIFEIQNFAAVMTHIVTIFSFTLILRRIQVRDKDRSVTFSGKPIVDMVIVEDKRNRENFDEREQGFMYFLSSVCDARKPAEKERSPEKEEARDCWEMEEDHGANKVMQCKVVPVSFKSLNDYETSNVMQTECYVDRTHLGLLPDEKVVTAWPETQRQNIMFFVIMFVSYCLLLIALECFLPEDLNWGVPGTIKRTIYLVGLLALAFHFYVEYRQEDRGLCVLTNSGRMVQLTRRPRSFFGHRFGGKAGVRVDSFQVGKIFMAQLDAPSAPLLIDRLRAWPRPAWRRGKVVIRGEHGYLEVSRRSGDVFEVYQVLQSMIDSRPVEGLPAPSGEPQTLGGITPARDLLSPGERMVWERRFDAYGFFGDPFNYSALLTISDCRTLVVRTRSPKPVSCRGILIGPRTCGTRCMYLQEMLGHHSWTTVTSLGHNHLESYATSRNRAPPFWPGFLSPVVSVTVTFLPRMLRSYPSGLTVVQRPYGLSRKVRVDDDVTLRPTRDGLLQIVSSNQRGAPCGTVVVSVDGHDARDLLLSSTPEAAEASPLEAKAGSRLEFEQASDDWQSMADEPWLRQLRTVLDHILGRSEIGEDIFGDFMVPPPRPGCLARCWAAFFGGDMLGHHHDAERHAEEEGTPAHGGATGSDVEESSSSYHLMSSTGARY